MTYEVFISYAYEDKKAADAVCHALEQHEVRCWIAPRDILPGAEWGAAIIDAIDTVRIMVLVFSSHSNASPQVRREIERAVSKGVVVLPFRIEEVYPCKTLEYFLGTQHWLDAFRKPLDPHIEVLTRTVKAILVSDGGEEPLFAVPNPGDAAPAVAAEIAPTGSECEEQARAHFAAEDLEAVQQRFAEYMGPMAKVMVCHAARQASGMDELVRQLAGEIPDETERAAFLGALSVAKA